MNHIEDRREPVFGDDIGDRMEVPIASGRATSIHGTVQPVLDARSLIERLGLGNAVPLLRIKLAFPPEVFALAARPLIYGHAEFVQMLPISGSGRSAQAGGQLQRALTSAIRALDRRRGQILPRSGAPEVIGAQAHRWTYAVFVSALLCDISQVRKGMRVWMEMGPGSTRAWNPSAGSMRVCGALGYRFEVLPFGVVSDEVDPAMALQLFERCVPASILDWLWEDSTLMAELRGCLSGNADPAGVINALVACDALGRSPSQGLVANVAPKVPAATPVVQVSAPRGPTIATVEPTEFLDEVAPDESALARQFMAWLSQAVQGGTLSVNTLDALVYVVADGLLLASPRIFREFARQQVVGAEPAADTAKQVQREVLRQGWHLRGDRGLNILCYERGRSDRGSNRINGIVIREPQRFIEPLPAIDLTLVRVVDGAGPSSPSPSD